MALKWNLLINQGETWQETFPVTPVDPETSIAGYVARGQVRATGTAELLHEWSSGQGNVIVTDSDVILDVTAATSSLWTWRHGVWALELTDPIGGGTTRLAEGWVFVSPETVRDE